MEIERHIIDSFIESNLTPLYEYNYPKFIIYAKRILGKEHEFYAEDCVQNAIYKIWTKRAIFSKPNISPITFRAYFYRSIFNEIINIKRTNTRFAKFVKFSIDEDDFFNSVIEQEVSMAIYNAITQLTDIERKVIELSYFKGLKNEEIEEQLSISLSSVKRHKRNALDFLKKSILRTITLLIYLQQSPLN